MKQKKKWCSFWKNKGKEHEKYFFFKFLNLIGWPSCKRDEERERERNQKENVTLFVFVFVFLETHSALTAFSGAYLHMYCVDGLLLLAAAGQRVAHPHHGGDDCPWADLGRHRAVVLHGHLGSGHAIGQTMHDVLVQAKHAPHNSAHKAITWD